jgi:outer membrane protein TolC
MNYENARLALINRVKKSFYEYHYINRAIVITGENVQLMTALEVVTRSKYRVGKTTHGAIIRAQVELGKLEDRLTMLRDLLDPARVDLNLALNRDPLLTLPVPAVLPDEPVLPDDTRIMALVKGKNPELQSMVYREERDKISIELARKNSHPDITLGVDYIFTGDALAPGTEDSGKDPILAHISIGLPIWRGKYRAAEKEAALRYQQEVFERMESENLLVTRTKRILFHHRDAARRRDLYKNSLIPKGRQNLAVAQKAYVADKIDFLDLIDAQRTLLEFRLAYERSCADLGQYQAELERLVGGVIPLQHSNDEEKSRIEDQESIQKSEG